MKLDKVNHPTSQPGQELGCQYLYPSVLPMTRTSIPQRGSTQYWILPRRLVHVSFLTCHRISGSMLSPWLFLARAEFQHSCCLVLIGSINQTEV